MQLVSKVSFFYSADLRTSCARAANIPSHKKSITLLTCCINNYFHNCIKTFFLTITTVLLIFSGHFFLFETDLSRLLKDNLNQ
jgi:hypothetical protein